MNAESPAQDERYLQPCSFHNTLDIDSVEVLKHTEDFAPIGETN